MTAIYDLRSDTVTKPTAAMREAMARAEVGDDVYGEDLTVNALQERVADLFGKEAGLFVPSGSLSNQLAIKTHTQPGNEVICEAGAHVFYFETGAPAVISQVQMRTLQGSNGTLSAAQVADAIRSDEYYYPRTALVCIENTHNKAGGRVFPLDAIRELRSLTSERGISLHLDGARIWNAHTATAVSFAEYGAQADSVSVCFSKGLGAPVGSMLLGTRSFITKAHKFRKILGGGMRQAGILAAAASYALDYHLPLLAQDHANAQRFAEALVGSTSFRIDAASVESNMVLLDFTSSTFTAAEALQRMASRGVLAGMSDARTVRVVFHLDVSAADTDAVITIMQELFR
jgi:threonine aldolase